MLEKLIRYLQKKLSTIHQESPGTDVPAEARGEGVVLRFQGRYDCGLSWPKDKLAPEDCPTHGEGCNRVYKEDGRVDFTGRVVSIDEARRIG